MIRMRPQNIGEFREVTFGNYFTYQANTDEATKGQYPYLIDVKSLFDTEDHPSNYRMAKILKTVVHVVVDETPDGSFIVDKWKIDNHGIYLK